MKQLFGFAAAALLAAGGCATNVPPHWGATARECSEDVSGRLVDGLIASSEEQGFVVEDELGSYSKSGAPEFISWAIYSNRDDVGWGGESLPVAMVVRTPGRVRAEVFWLQGLKEDEVDELVSSFEMVMSRAGSQCKIEIHAGD